jgi:hypothetical protein
LAPGCEFGAFSSFAPRGAALPVRRRSVGGIPAYLCRTRSTKCVMVGEQTRRDPR